MSRVQILPKDVRESCLSYVRGYERRKREYALKRAEVLSNTSSRIVTIKDKDHPEDERKDVGVVLPGSHNASRLTEDQTIKLQGLEELPETKRMRAVEYAAELIGIDLPECQRKKLVRAIFLSCTQGRKYPFERLGIVGMERSCFYDRRMKFLVCIAKYMELI